MLVFIARRLWPAALLIPVLALAIEPDAGAGPPLDLHAAIARSLQANPELAVQHYELKALEGAHTQAGMSPNPEVSVEIEDVLGSGDRRGLSAAQTTLSLRQILERGARERRLEAAGAAHSQAQAERAEQRMDVAAETARRYFRVLSDQERLRLTHEASLLAERAVDAARVRVRAAQAPDAELARAEAQKARTLLDHEDVEHELLTARHELAALWGAETPDFGLAQGDLLAMPDTEPFEALARRIEANPSLLKFASTARLREAELRLVEQKRRSPWTVSAGLRRNEDGDDLAAVAGLTIPLRLRDPVRGEVVAAQTRLAQVEVQRSASALRIRTRLFGWLQELSHARHAAQTLDQDVIPRMSAALDQTEYAYRRGRYGYAELVAAQRELLEVKRARIEVAVDAYRYATEIDRLTGELPGLDAADAALASTTP